MLTFNVCFTRATSEEVTYKVRAESAEQAQAIAGGRLETDEVVDWQPTDFFGQIQAHVTCSTPPWIADEDDL